MNASRIKMATEVVQTWSARKAFRKLALRQKTLKELMKKGRTFGVLSAYTKGSKKENQKRHGQLIADLQKMGYRKTETLKGQWEGVAEKSVIVPNMKHKDLFKLGQKYGQDATIHKSANGIIGMYYHDKGIVEVAVDPKGEAAIEMKMGKDLFTDVGRNWSFEFGFLFGEGIPWDGKKPVTPETVKKKLLKDKGPSKEDDKKLNPDQYREEHGKCPTGYQFDGDHCQTQ